jgi:hypothetical protein
MGFQFPVTHVILMFLCSLSHHISPHFFSQTTNTRIMRVFLTTAKSRISILSWSSVAAAFVSPMTVGRHVGAASAPPFHSLQQRAAATSKTIVDEAQQLIGENLLRVLFFVVSSVFLSRTIC